MRPIAASPRTSDQACRERKCAQGLGFAGNPGDYTALGSALHDPDVEVRREAVWVLARLGEIRALPLIDKALCDPDREVRQIARGVTLGLRSRDGSAR